MSPLALLFLALAGVGTAVLPLRWLPVLLLAAASHMALGEGVSVAGFHVPVLRLLIAGALVRVAISGQGPAGGIQTLDRLIAAWAAWALISAAFHAEPGAVFMQRLGIVLNAAGVYSVVRVACRGVDEVLALIQAMLLLLLPLAALMAWERIDGTNLYALLTGVPELSDVRGGVVRARGPFLHAILAGTVGATCLPLAAAAWPRRPLLAAIGVAACAGIVLASASSGPMLSAAIGVIALGCWPLRRRLRLLRWGALFSYVALELATQAPAYFLIARIDLTGNSTSWHRAELIRAALTHWSEWWLVGTDYTRHWIAYGVPWSSKHVDVTNHYLMLGVYGGLPLMLVFIAGLASGFAIVGRVLRHADPGPSGRATRLTAWALGGALTAHAGSMLSVSYFDQSVLFLYVVLGALAALGGPRRASGMGTGRGPRPCTGRPTLDQSGDAASRPSGAGSGGRSGADGTASTTRRSKSACAATHASALKRWADALASWWRPASHSPRFSTRASMASTSGSRLTWRANRAARIVCQFTASGSPSGLGTQRPPAGACPSCSTAPPTSLSTTGTPAYSASIEASDQPSKKESSTKPSAAASSVDGSVLWSRRCIRPEQRERARRSRTCPR